MEFAAVYFNEPLTAPVTTTLTVTGPASNPATATLAVTCGATTPFGTPCTAIDPTLEPGIYNVSETGVPGTDALWGDGTPGDPQ